MELPGVESETPQARGPAQLEFGLAERAVPRFGPDLVVRLYALTGDPYGPRLRLQTG